MAHQKGTYIDGYKVSMTLKENQGVETCRVRDASGRLFVLKLGVNENERRYCGFSPLTVAVNDRYVLYRHISGETLLQRVSRLGRIDDDEATDLLTDILVRLNDFHRNGLAHANLTADNVVVDLSGMKPEAYIVGLGKLHRAVGDDLREDIVMTGHLAALMLDGQPADEPHEVKVRVTGAASQVRNTMLRALASGFDSADAMLECLRGIDKTRDVPAPAGPGFSAVAGMDSLKEKLRNEVIDILADREGAARYGLEIPNGMLLYGPPGCGKTFIAERFAEETASFYRLVKSSDLASTYLHGAQEKIAALFDEARRNAPAILCFDEFDALVPRRDDISNASHSAEVNEFLSQMNNCGKDGVFVIATSNRPDHIDIAVLRSGRIDYPVYVGIPDVKARHALFSLLLDRRPCAGDVDCDMLADMTDGYVASDIEAIVQQASRMAFKAKSEISMKLLSAAVTGRKPSLSKAELSAYEKLRDRFENRGGEKGHRKVGFM